MKKHNLVVANWKMNPESLRKGKEIFNKARISAKEFKNVDVIICPPSLYLYPFSKLLLPKNLFLGAQNVASEEKGPFTGEVSACMNQEASAKFVILGHSERRAMGETNEMIKKKLQAVFNARMQAIFCVGEKIRDKEGAYLEIIKNQIKESLQGLQKKNLLGLIIAYEPIWAIGKSYKEAMSPTDIHETTLLIKKIAGEIFGKDIAASFKILYGGSVEAENAQAIMERGNVTGFLVGHDSLIPEHFSKILEAANK